MVRCRQRLSLGVRRTRSCQIRELSHYILLYKKIACIHPDLVSSVVCAYRRKYWHLGNTASADFASRSGWKTVGSSAWMYRIMQFRSAERFDSIKYRNLSDEDSESYARVIL